MVMISSSSQFIKCLIYTNFPVSTESQIFALHLNEQCLENQFTITNADNERFDETANECFYENTLFEQWN